MHFLHSITHRKRERSFVFYDFFVDCPMMVAGAAVRNKNLTAGILSVSNVKEKWWQKKSQRSTHTVQKQSAFSVVRRQFVRCSHSFIHFGDKPIRRSGSTILANISQWDFLYSFSLLSLCPFFLIWFILRFGFRNDASSAAFYADSFFSSIIFFFFFFIFSCRCDRICFFRPLDVGRWLVWCCVVTLFMNAIASFKSMLLISIPMITILKGFDDNIHFYRGEKKLHLGRFNFDSSVCGSCFLFSLKNLWTTGRICLLMVFQLNCSIGFAVKLPDLICVFHFTRWMSVLIFFLSLSRALSSIPDFSTCVQLFPPALKHTM